MSSSYEFVVIGGGSGGVRSARIAAQNGARVALIESSALGGTCVNLGCVPKKLFSYAASFKKASQVACSFGWEPTAPGFDWPKLITHKNKEIARLNGIYKGILEKSGVDIYRGLGHFKSSHQISVVDQGNVTTLEAKNTLIATGSTPFVPRVEGAEHFVVSDDLFHLPELPKRILIYGSGYIAVEFASIFSGLGVEVDLVYRGDRILKHFDQDISTALAHALTQQGIHLKPEHEIVRIEGSEKNYQVYIKAKGSSGENQSQVLQTELVVAATGRKPNVRNLKLENIGIELGPTGNVLVDEFFETQVPNIYAVGDIIERVALTPVAIREGANVANTLFGGGKAGSALKPLNYKLIPTAVFTHPQVSTVGLTELEAMQQSLSYQCYRSEFTPMKYSFSEEKPRTFMKMIVDTNNDRVLGLHMMGEDAAEMMQGFAVAMSMNATKADFDATVGIHPSSAEEWVTLN